MSLVLLHKKNKVGSEYGRCLNLDLKWSSFEIGILGLWYGFSNPVFLFRINTTSKPRSTSHLLDSIVMAVFIIIIIISACRFHQQSHFPLSLESLAPKPMAGLVFLRWRFFRFRKALNRFVPALSVTNVHFYDLLLSLSSSMLSMLSENNIFLILGF